MNKVILIGRLVKKPELRYTQNNKQVAQFTLAVNKIGSEDANFINIIVWNKFAEICEKYLDKGSQIAVEGKINTRSYENNEGKKVYITEVIAENIEFLDSKKKDDKDDEVKKDPFQEFADEMKEQELPF